MRPKLWVCESCGDCWEGDVLRDDHGHVVCTDCLALARWNGAPSPLVLPAPEGDTDGTD